MANTTPTALRAVPTYRTELDRLATLLPPLADLFETIMIESEQDKMDKALANIRRDSPRNDDDPDALCVLDASREAADIALRLSVSQRLREYADRPHPAADLLIRLARENRVKPGPDLDEFVRNLPWLLRSALEMLISTGCVQDRPTSKEAITARMLAAFVECLDKLDGLRHSPPDELTH